MKRLINFIVSALLVNLLTLTVVWSLMGQPHALLAGPFNGDPVARILLPLFVVATSTSLVTLVSLLDWFEASCTSLPDAP